MFKNVASQKLAVFAWDNASGAPKTGNAAQISAQLSKDGGATAATNDAAPTELDATDAKGIYIFDMTQAETNADLVILSAVSSTADIDLQPVIIYTLKASAAEITSDPGNTPDALDILQFIYQAIRNQRDTTGNSDEIHTAAGVVAVTFVISDDGVTFSKSKGT